MDESAALCRSGKRRQIFSSILEEQVAEFGSRRYFEKTLVNFVICVSHSGSVHSNKKDATVCFAYIPKGQIDYIQFGSISGRIKTASFLYLAKVSFIFDKSCDIKIALILEERLKR